MRVIASFESRLAAERVEDGADERREAAEVADGVQADAVVEELVALREQELAQEQHQRVDLVLRPGPVLLAERVERERAEAEAARGADRPADGVRPLAGALATRGRPRCCAHRPLPSMMMPT